MPTGALPAADTTAHASTSSCCHGSQWHLRLSALRLGAAGFLVGPAQPEPLPVMVLRNRSLQIKCSRDLSRILLFGER